MARHDDTWKNLSWLEEELLAEEEEYEEDYDEDSEEEDWEEEESASRSRRRSRVGLFSRAVYTGEEFDEDSAVLAEEPNKKIGGLLLLAALEIGAIYAIIRWWLQWL